MQARGTLKNDGEVLGGVSKAAGSSWFISSSPQGDERRQLGMLETTHTCFKPKVCKIHKTRVNRTLFNSTHDASPETMHIFLHLGVRFEKLGEVTKDIIYLAPCRGLRSKVTAVLMAQTDFWRLESVRDTAGQQ